MVNIWIASMLTLYSRDDNTRYFRRFDERSNVCQYLSFNWLDLVVEVNPELQHKFEKQMMTNGIVKDRKMFNKNTKGIYEFDLIYWMYRVWVSQEARIETLQLQHKSQIEESFMCGYTEAEYDFKYKNKEKMNGNTTTVR